MNDLERCINELERYGAHYFTRFNSENATTEVICYEPYVIYNIETKAAEVISYVYHWKDSYDEDGNFISHEAYEGVYSHDFDTSI